MRILLKKPNTKKYYISGCDNDLSYGLCSMQGWRKSMEDAHCVEVSLPGDLKKWSFFAILDGHGGKEVSTYCAEHLLSTIMKMVPFKSSNENCTSSSFIEEVQEAFKKAFLHLDCKIRRLRITRQNLRVGSTVISVFISSTYFYIANLGDSRLVISSNGEVRFITVDHKPDSECERQRIERSGGHVFPMHSPRINGQLAVSRSIGDYAFKQMWSKWPFDQMVSSEPTVNVLDRRVDDEFLVLACDGIWDVLEPKQLCDYIRYMLHIIDDLEYICKSIIDACFFEGSRDNMSIIIILLPGAPKISESFIEQDNLFQLVLRERIKDILLMFGEMKAGELTKMLSIDLQLEPFLEGLPFKESFCFQYTTVKSILMDL